MKLTTEEITRLERLRQPEPYSDPGKMVGPDLVPETDIITSRVRAATMDIFRAQPTTAGQLPRRLEQYWGQVAAGINNAATPEAGDLVVQMRAGWAYDPRGLNAEEKTIDPIVVTPRGR